MRSLRLHLERFWMAFRFQYFPDTLVRLGIDHRDTTIIFAEPYKNHFCRRIVTQVVGIASEVDCLPQRVLRAVKDSHFPVAGVRDVQFVILRNIQRSLRLVQILDAVNDPPCESIDYFERVVTQSRNEKSFALYVSGKVVNPSGHTRDWNLFFQLQRKSLPARSLGEGRFCAAVCQNSDHYEQQSSYQQLLHRSPFYLLHTLLIRLGATSSIQKTRFKAAARIPESPLPRCREQAHQRNSDSAPVTKTKCRPPIWWVSSRSFRSDPHLSAGRRRCSRRHSRGPRKRRLVCARDRNRSRPCPLRSGDSRPPSRSANP